MNIGFVVSHLSHGSPGSFERTRLMCRHLNGLGVTTTLLTPYQEDVYRITDVDMQLIPNTMASIGLSSFGYMLIRKFASHRTTSKLFLSDKSILRMVNNIRSGIHKILKEKRFDVLNAVQPIAGLACARIAKEFNIPLITDLHNIWPEELAVYGIIERSDDRFNLLHNYEQTIIESSDVITVVSEVMKSYITQNYSVKHKSIIVVPPAGSAIDISPEVKRERNVVYAGLVSNREHVDLYAHSIPYVKQDASFFISDRGDAVNDVKKITNASSYPKIRYFWFTNRNEAVEFLKRSKIGILTSHNDITRQIGPACKLFEYMSCGLPVVANDIGGWTEMIENEQIGLLTEDDPKDFASSIDRILSDESLWHKMHTNALHTVKTKNNWQENAQKILIPLYRSLYH